MEYTFQQQVAIAHAMWILREHAPASTPVLMAIARLEICLPVKGTPAARDVWLAVPRIEPNYQS